MRKYIEVTLLQSVPNEEIMKENVSTLLIWYCEYEIKIYLGQLFSLVALLKYFTIVAIEKGGNDNLSLPHSTWLNHSAYVSFADSRHRRMCKETQNYSRGWN